MTTDLDRPYTNTERLARMRRNLVYVLHEKTGLPFMNYYVVEDDKTICWDRVTGEVHTIKVGETVRF